MGLARSCFPVRASFEAKHADLPGGPPVAAHKSYKLARAGHEEDVKHKKKGRDSSPGPSSRSKALALGGLVGPYLAIDLLDEGLAVLVLLLELAHLLELLGGEALDPLGDLLDGQLIVVRGLEGAQHGGPQLGLAGDLLGLPEDVFGPLGGLLGYPQALPGGLLGGPKPLSCYLLSDLKPLLGGPLEGPHALLGVGEGAEEVAVGTDPTLGKRPHVLLLPARGPREVLGGAHVLLGLLAHYLKGLTHPALYRGVGLRRSSRLWPRRSRAGSLPSLGRCAPSCRCSLRW